MSSLLRRIAVSPVLFYQQFISPGLPRRCKYEPTCSAYAVDAVREFGVARGFVLAGWRLLRCNPWSRGGIDPVCDQKLFGHDHAHAHAPGSTTR